MNMADQNEWDYLQEQWGEAYVFEYDDSEIISYNAIRRDNDQTKLRAYSVEALKRLVRANYSSKPVPRGM
jgi:hypothetical protein